MREDVCMLCWCFSAIVSVGVHAGGYTVPPGQDVMISVYNIHHSPAVWDDPEAFKPERFPIDEPVPTEANTDYRHASSVACMTVLSAGSQHLNTCRVSFDVLSVEKFMS